MSVKNFLAVLTLGVAFVAAPVVADAHVIVHKPVAKHVVRKHATKVHRKHVKHAATKAHKSVVVKGLHGRKPVVSKKVSPGKTGSGWQHHPKSV